MGVSLVKFTQSKRATRALGVLCSAFAALVAFFSPAGAYAADAPNSGAKSIAESKSGAAEIILASADRLTVPAVAREASAPAKRRARNRQSSRLKARKFIK